MVRALGRELYLRHLAGPARTARNRSGHDARLDSARARLAGKLSERRRRLGRNMCHLRRSFGQRKRRKHCFTDVLGNHGHLRVWRSQSAQRTTRVALFAFDPTGGWVMERTSNHRHRFPRRVLLKIRHVSAKFPAPRARYLRELPPRCRPSAELFPLRLTNSVVKSRSSRAAQTPPVQPGPRDLAISERTRVRSLAFARDAVLS